VCVRACVVRACVCVCVCVRERERERERESVCYACACACSCVCACVRQTMRHTLLALAAPTPEYLHTPHVSNRVMAHDSNVEQQEYGVVTSPPVVNSAHADAPLYQSSRALYSSVRSSVDTYARHTENESHSIHAASLGAQRRGGGIGGAGTRSKLGVSSGAQGLYTHTFTRARAHTHRCTHTYIRTHAYTHAHTHVRTQLCAYMRMQLCAYTHAHAHIYTHP